MKLKIGKNATVEVLTGADRGKKGTVIEVDPVKMRIKVQGVRVQTHFDPKEGIQTKEGFINYSNVKLIEAAKAPTKGKKKAAKAKSA